MNIIVNRVALLDIVGAARLAIPGRTPKPVLQCVHLRAESNKLEASGTCLSQYIKASTAMVQIEEPGVSVVDAEKLAQILSQSEDDTVTLKADGSMMKVQTTDATFKLYEQRAQDFPPEPPILEPVVRHIGAGALKSLFERVQHANAKESTRYAFHGVLLDIKKSVVLAVATDGRRLAKAAGETSDSGKDISVILPMEAIKAFVGCDIDAEAVVTLEVSENSMALSTESVRISTTLLEGQFPPYDDVIPQDSDKVATLPREAFLRAVKQASLMTHEESKGCRLSFSVGGLTMTARAPELGDAEVRLPCKYQGPGIEIGFNPTFMHQAVSACTGEEVTLSMTAPNRPGRIDDGQSLCLVLMPVNLL